MQRCQWHKREGVLSHLPKGRQGRIGRKLQAAYDEPTYEGAKGALGRLRKELELLNRSAVKSLDEGLEETLTLHRLGVFPILGRSLKTTNCLESIMSLIAQRTDRVDHWRNSDQKQRWVATALLDIEPRLNRIQGYRHLPVLRAAIRSTLGLRLTATSARWPNMHPSLLWGHSGISTKNGIDSVPVTPPARSAAHPPEKSKDMASKQNRNSRPALRNGEDFPSIIRARAFSIGVNRPI